MDSCRNAIFNIRPTSKGAMSSMTDSSTSSFNDTANAEPTKPVRVTFAVLLVAIFWAFYATVGILDLGNFPSFLMRFGAVAVLLLLFLIWWLTNRSSAWEGAPGRSGRGDPRRRHLRCFCSAIHRCSPLRCSSMPCQSSSPRSRPGLSSRAVHRRPGGASVCSASR